MDVSNDTVIAPPGVVAATLALRFSRILNVVDDFGALGNGSSDTTSAIQAAENAAHAGMALYFPPGTYMINSSGVTKKDGVSWIGGGDGQTALRAITGPVWTNSLVTGVVGASNLIISNIVFDWNNAATPSSGSVDGCLQFVTGSNIRVHGCQFIHIGIFGVIINGSTNFSITDCIFSKDEPSTSQNEAILVSPASGQPSPGIIKGNVCINTAMDLSATRLFIINNIVTNWAYGSGITLEPVPQSSFCLVSGNICFGGKGPDANATYCTGIENWAPYTVISDNICGYNVGDGIDNNAIYSLVKGNICLNNGQNTGYFSAGIRSGYLNDSQCGNFSLIANNLCVDTQSNPTQKYGYADVSASLIGITLEGNLFSRNAVAPMLSQSADMAFHGPKLWSLFGIGPQTLAPGTTTSFTVSLPSAQLGDMASVSADTDLQGLLIFANVQAGNSVNVHLANLTGQSITISNPNGTIVIRIAVEKPINYAAY